MAVLRERLDKRLAAWREAHSWAPLPILRVLDRTLIQEIQLQLDDLETETDELHAEWISVRLNNMSLLLQLILDELKADRESSL